MAIQDLINEVNSIQTKKQAIKEAITSKGVASEGKLSKFADEIKQITTKEPDWYIVNKFRYENGNEALLVRSSDKDVNRADKYQMVEIGGGVTKDNNIGRSFNGYSNDGFGVTNGTYFPRVTAYCSFPTYDFSNIVFDGHNDNLKLRIGYDKDIVFRDVNVYNWLKGYRNQPLADFNTLYLKSDGFNSSYSAKNLTDFLAPTTTPTTLTVRNYGQIPLLLIDSSIIVKVMNFNKDPGIGFVSYSDKTTEAISLDLQYSIYDISDNVEKLYGNLSPGNYVQLVNRPELTIVFVSVNFVIDNNNQKHKNIEVYGYRIKNANGNMINPEKFNNKPFELYLTFSSQARQQLQQTSNINDFRNKVLAVRN